MKATLVAATLGAAVLLCSHCAPHHAAASPRPVEESNPTRSVDEPNPTNGVDSGAATGPSRPIRFVAVIIDNAHPREVGVEWNPGATLPTPLVGWTCSMGKIEDTLWSDQAPWVPGAKVRLLAQYAEIVCTNSSGSVAARATCDAKREPEDDGADLRITDGAGHRALIHAGCRNY